MLNLNTKTSNCFIRMLTLLEVKHTWKYAEELYESNPRNNTLLGLTEMFAKYNIQRNVINLIVKLRWKNFRCRL